MNKSSHKKARSPEVIVLIISSLDFGGAQKILVWLANQLADQGFSIKILTLSAPSKPALAINPLVEILHLDEMSASNNRLTSALASLRRVRRLRAEIRSLRPKKIISFMDRMNVLVLIAAIGLKLEILVSERSHPTKNSPSALLNLLRRLFYPLASSVIFQTEGARSKFSWISDARAKIISNPSEPSPLEPSNDRDSRVITGLGRLSPEKGFDLLVRAFAKVSKQFSGWRLCIYGDGPARNGLEQLARSLDIQVDLPGWTSPSKAFSNACLFVLPSYFEGFPNSLLEAMSARIPVISSDCEFGPREILKGGECGMLFKTGDQLDLESKLAEMIQSQVLRDDLAARAYQALERYQPDFIFDQWKKVLKIGPKKVVFLIRSLQLGGAERQLVNLVNHLDRSQIEPIILTFYAGGVLESSLRSDVQVISLHKRGRWNNLLFLMQLKAKLKALQPDIVYSFLTTSNIFAAVLRFFDDSFKLVWGIRSATMDLKRFGIVAQIEGLVENLVSRVPDLIICNADAARDDRIARGYNSSRLTVVANGIDCNEFQVDLSQRASFRANLGLTDRNFVFGIVARFDPMKGYEIFLEAAAKAIQLNSDIRFLILGSGKSSYKEQLQQLSRNLQLDSHVFWLSDVRLRDFYNALDAFTLTSLGESFPNVLAEAMSCGLPCVSTDVGDSGRIINCFGQTVPSRNPEALATAWIQMAAKGSQWDSQTISDSIRARFGLERYAEETCKAFQQLA